MSESRSGSGGVVVSRPVVETWRVETEVRTSPAHVVVFELDGVRITACGWTLPKHGVLLDRAGMLAACRFACVRCMKVVAKR